MKEGSHHAWSELCSRRVVVPAVIDHVQGQVFAALQALKVVEAGIEPGGLGTRREYARWLITSSAIVSFDDITPEDPDFPSIQGLVLMPLVVVTESETDSISTSEYANDESSPVAFNFKAKSSSQTIESERASTVPVSESAISLIFSNLDA
eukprot:Gb_15762 [translate_table: standard]